MQSAPLDLILEFVRAEQAGDPHAFRFAPQDYLLRSPGGGFETARFEWDQALLADLNEVRRPGRDPAVVQRLGETLRRFLSGAGWADREAQILDAVRAERPIHLTLRFAAAELFALPWELLTIKSTGQHIGELPQLLLRYEWPETTSASETPARPSGGRILFAWSAAAGAVPAVEHLTQIETACRVGFHPFDRQRDVLPNASCSQLITALEAARSENRPIEVLHLLCHGIAIGGTFGLALDGDNAGEGAVAVDAGRLRQLLAPYAQMLRLIVLCACDSGNSGALGNQLGSVAQTLHRAGIAAVVASRYPLSASGSIRLTGALYSQLLIKLRSLETALRFGRSQLLQESSTLDWASLQFYARASDGDDTRPVLYRPFRGLLAFQSRHSRFFFGRQPVIDEICSDLAALIKAGKPRFLVVAGASGTGKSSVALAGAVPQLIAKTPALRIAIMRPGSDPDKALTDALSGLAEAPASTERPLLLVVDQLEEIFTHTELPAARQAFLRKLWQLARDDRSYVWVVTTLRVDFIGRCGDITLDDAGQRLDAVAYDEAHRVFVPQMGAAALRQAIEEPARLCGLVLEEGLSPRMIADVGGEPGALPLLQDTLDILWQRRSGHTLTQAAYDEVGGVAGALHGRADALFSSLNEAEQKVARRLLVRLVNVGEDITLSTRRRVPLDRLRPSDPAEGQRFDRVLSQLIDARLLVRDGVGAAQLVEVAHEALIRKWARLGDWVRADRKMLAALERISAWVAEWQDIKTLLVSSQIGVVELFIKDYKDDCPQEAHALLDASRRFAWRRRRTRMWLQIVGVIASLLVAGAGGFGIYQTVRVLAAASASRDALRMSAVRTLLEEDEQGLSMSLLRDFEAEDLERMPGWWTSATTVLRDMAYEEQSWKLPTGRMDNRLVAISPDCLHVAVTASSPKRPAVSPDRPAPIITLIEKDRAIGTLNLQERHHPPGTLDSMALSPNMRFLVTFSAGTPRRFSLDAQTPPESLGGIAGITRDSGFSADGSQFLALDQNGLVHHWDMEKLREVPGLLRHDRAPHGRLAIADTAWMIATRDPSLAAAFPPSMQSGTISTGSVDLWIDRTRRPLLFEKPVAVLAVTLCQDHKRLATASPDGTMRIWRLGLSPSELGMFVLPTSQASQVVVSPDGQQIFIAPEDNTIQVWNSDGSFSMEFADSLPIQKMLVSPDGKKLFIIHVDHSAQIRNTDGSGTPIYLTTKIRSQGAVFIDSHRLLVADAYLYEAGLIDVDSGKAIWFKQTIPSAEQQMALSPDGSRFVWIDLKARSVHILNVDNPQETRTIYKHADAVAFSADGSSVVAVDQVGGAHRASILLTGDAEPIVSKLEPINQPYQLKLSPGLSHYAQQNAQMLRVGSFAGSARPSELSQPMVPLDSSMMFSADSSRFLWFHDAQLATVRTAGGPWIKLSLEARVAQQISLSQDGKLFVMISQNGVPQVWNLDRMDDLRTQVLRKRMWQSNAGCLNPSGLQRFLNLSDNATRWDFRSCERMQKCVDRARTNMKAMDYEACLHAFQARQQSWQRELDLPNLPGRKSDSEEGHPLLMR